MERVETVLKQWENATLPLNERAIAAETSSAASSKPSPSSPASSAAFCRPYSHESFLQRVSSFSISTWFAKPASISALQCARYGWTNTAVDMLSCPSCAQSLCCRIDPQLNEASAESLGQRYAQQLTSAHLDLCVWKENPSPLSFTMVWKSIGIVF